MATRKVVTTDPAKKTTVIAAGFELPLALHSAISFKDGCRLIDDAGESLTCEAVAGIAAGAAACQDLEAIGDLKRWAGWARAAGVEGAAVQDAQQPQ